MNRDYIDTHDVIGRYLRHELTDEEYTAFHLYLLQHPDFKKEVEAERHAYRALRARTVTTQRHTAMATPFKPRTLVLLAILVLTGLWYWQRINRVSAPAPSPAPLNIPPVQAPADQQDTPESAPMWPQDTPKLTTRPASEPIAAADYSPNPYLEPYLDGSTRSSRADAARLSMTTLDTLQAAGTYVSLPITYFWETPQPLNGRLLLFTNAPSDYLDFRPLWEKSLPLSPATAMNQNTLVLNIDLSPGLYYLLFEDRDSGEYWAVNRIVILH